MASSNPAQQKAQAWSKTYDEMRAKYTVMLPGLPEPAGQMQEAPPSPRLLRKVQEVKTTRRVVLIGRRLRSEDGGGNRDNFVGFHALITDINAS